ncbi:MAG: M1 family peptidase, partial [Dokdonella sp.]
MGLGSTLATAGTSDRLPGQGLDVVRYELSLTPDMRGAEVSGVESIVVRSLEKDLRRIVFSPNALIVDRASIDGQTVHVQRGATGVQFDLPTVLRRGQSAVLRISYHGAPARGVVRSPTGVYTSYF